MTTFNIFSDILPDPIHKITEAGDLDDSGSPGPGFTSVNFRSVRDSSVSKTISNRTISRDTDKHSWEFGIRYNPMFRDEFEPVMSFLESRPRSKPFYIVLPQYSKPRDSQFYSYVLEAGGMKLITSTGNGSVGSNSMLVSLKEYSPGLSRPINKYHPKQGDIFTIDDPDDINHKKVYRINAVETSDRSQAGNEIVDNTINRLHFSPPLHREVSTSATIVFDKPKFRVIQKSDILEHELNNEGLYSFSLDMEEALP